MSHNTIDLEGIKARIPHRDPMLLIDSIKDVVKGEGCTGIKEVRISDSYFKGHFPGHPIMPGVLIIEAMAQTAGTLVVETLGNFENSSSLVYFMAIEEARFRHPVMPGDRLELRVKKDRHRGHVWRFRGEAYVGDKLCAEALFTAMLVPAGEKFGGQDT